MKEENKTFEEAIKELEEVVKKLESGDLTLDESILLFQKGIGLSKYCNTRLDEVEHRISKLIESSDGELEEVSFETGAGAEE